MAFKEEYILSVNKFDNRYIEDRDDLANILYDEYLLDYSFVNNANKLKVFVKSDDDLTKLNKMIKKYAIDKKYADEIIDNNTNESIKNINYNKMENRIFRNGSRFTSLRERMMNERRERSNRLDRVASRKRRELGESFDERINRRIRRVEELNEPLRFTRKNERVERPRLFNRANASTTRRTERPSLREVENRSVISESLLRKIREKRLERLNEAENAKKCPTTFEGKKIEKMTKAEKRSAAAQVRKDIKEAQKLLKERQKEGRSTKLIEAKIEKLQCLLDCLTNKEELKESVRSRFARTRRIFEAEEEDNTEDDNTPDTEDDNTPDTEKDSTEDEEFDDVEVKAVTLKVLNKNVDKLKDALIDAGVEEEDIEVTDNEDAEDDDEVGIKVDVNSFDTLKSYCDSVGIDLEEELGGDIVSDEEKDAEEKNNNDEESTPTDSEENKEDDDNFTDAELEDIFK